MAAAVHDITIAQERVQTLAEQGLWEIPSTYIRPLEERPTNCATAGVRDIPVIDLASLEKGRPRIVADVGRACEEWGLFQVINHGVPLPLLERMREIAGHFFAMSLQEKLTYACKEGSTAPEGYGSRMLVKEEQVLDWRDYLDHHTLPLSRRNPSCWPCQPTYYRETVEEYSEELKGLAQRLLGLISESLGLSPSFIEDSIGDPYQNITINYYPPCPQPHLTLGLQAHSDMGAITLLLQDDVAGLQVYKDYEWIVVQPLTDAFVVQLGDMLQILSNDTYKSVEHRAVVNRDKPRISVATFYDPCKSICISPAEPLLDDEHPPLFRGVLFGEHVSTWYSQGPDGKKTIDSLVIFN